MQNCWNKYGEDAFEFSVVELVEELALLLVEQRYLDANFKNKSTCMNVALCATAPMKGRKHSDEARRKNSESNKGRIVSAETRQRMRKPKPSGFGDKLRQALTGKKHNPERVANERAAQACRPVRGTSIETGAVIEFSSVAEAQRAGFDGTHVLRCCNGENKRHKGFLWTDINPAWAPSEHERAERRAKREAAKEQKNKKAREHYWLNGREEKNRKARERAARLRAPSAAPAPPVMSADTPAPGPVVTPDPPRRSILDRFRRKQDV